MGDNNGLNELVEMKSKYDRSTDRFNQDDYFMQQKALQESRQEKIKELFPPPEHPILFEWSNLNLSVPVKKSFIPYKKNTPQRHILKNLSGFVAPGEFLAILGPSGAGKTSLLHSLAGRIPLKSKDSKDGSSGLTGEILVNGVNRGQSFVDRASCFVLQEDLFFGELTVKQTLRFTSRLAMPKEVSNKEKDQRARELTELLRLKKCENTSAGSMFRRGVSGGEKKRLNIANELLSNATLIMMDEPTSGLDASTALLVVSLLSDLAKSGKTVIATLHQPSSQMFHMFDKLLLLADGQTAFLGSAKEALPYFADLGFKCPSQYNPADYLLNILDEVPSNEGTNYRTALLRAYAESENAKEYEDSSSDTDEEKGNAKSVSCPPPLPSTIRKGFQASYWTQIWLLMGRSAKQHMIEAIPNFITFVILSIFAAIYWWRLGYSESDIANRKGLLFFVVWNALILPMFSALSEVSKERILIRKERPTRLYRLSAYILSKAIANAPIDAVAPTVMSAVIYWACNLNAQFHRFVIYCIFSFLGQLSGMGLGIAIGVNFDMPEAATPLVLFFFFAMTITGGFFIAISDIPTWINWTKYLSLLKYWADAVVVNEFDDDSHTFKVKNPYKGQPPYITGDEILKNEHLIFGHKIWPAALILLGSYIAALFLSYILLRFHTRRKTA